MNAQSNANIFVNKYIPIDINRNPILSIELNHSTGNLGQLAARIISLENAVLNMSLLLL